MRKENNQTIINGGEEIEITLLDGTAETVLVKLLKIKKFEDYLRVVDNEAAAAELLTGKEPGWGDTVSPDSLLDICEKGHDINFSSVYRWAARRADVNEALLPVAKKGQALSAASPTSAPIAPS